MIQESELHALMKSKFEALVADTAARLRDEVEAVFHSGSSPNLGFASPTFRNAMVQFWDQDLAKRAGVTFETIQRFRALGWLPDGYGLAS